jgi:hypothetical protein
MSQPAPNAIFAQRHCFKEGSVSNESDNAWREPLFNVTFESSAKLSDLVSGKPPLLFPGAACGEKWQKCGSPGK